MEPYWKGVFNAKINNTSSHPIELYDYSEKSLGLKVTKEFGKKFSEDLRNLGGKYNSHLSFGQGWIFSKKKQEDLHQFIEDTFKNYKAGEILSFSDEIHSPKPENIDDIIEDNTEETFDLEILECLSPSSEADKIFKLLKQIENTIHTESFSEEKIETSEVINIYLSGTNHVKIKTRSEELSDFMPIYVFKSGVNMCIFLQKVIN